MSELRTVPDEQPDSRDVVANGQVLAPGLTEREAPSCRRERTLTNSAGRADFALADHACKKGASLDLHAHDRASTVTGSSQASPSIPLTRLSQAFERARNQRCAMSAGSPVAKRWGQQCQCKCGGWCPSLPSATNRRNQAAATHAGDRLRAVTCCWMMPRALPRVQGTEPAQAETSEGLRRVLECRSEIDHSGTACAAGQRMQRGHARLRTTYVHRSSLPTSRRLRKIRPAVATKPPSCTCPTATCPGCTAPAPAAEDRPG